MIPTIASKWSELETDMLRNGVEKRLVEAYRRVFYGGAFASLVVIAESDISTATATQIETIRKEIMDALRETQS